MEELVNISDENFLKILSTVRTVGNIDLIHCEPVILCHRFERFMQLQGFRSVETLTAKMMQDKNFANFFLNSLRIPTTEMFRDPQTWIELETLVLPKLKGESVIKIWVPDICGDDELNSLLILLDRNELLKKSMVYATSIFEEGIDEAKRGLADSKKMEISADNFKHVYSDENLEKYFEKCDKSYLFSGKLLEHVIFLKHNLFSEAPPDMGFNLILLRNRALIYSMQTRKNCIEKLYKSLLTGGYFILGIGETLKGLEQTVKFYAVSKTENIFKKY